MLISCRLVFLLRSYLMIAYDAKIVTDVKKVNGEREIDS